MSNNWPAYFEKTKNNPPRRMLVKALPYVGERGQALDIGSGALNDSSFLLKEGFMMVTALDLVPVAKEIADMLPADRFKYVISPLESYEFPVSRFDLVNAQYVLPFVPPSSFQSVFKKILASMKVGAIFTGQFFGEKDGWADDNEKTFTTKERAVELLSGLEVIYFEEEENDKPTAAGVPKHWHVFHFIARKLV